jgi:hypothetical protein
MQESLDLYLTILTIPFTQDAGVPGPVPDYPDYPLHAGCRSPWACT